MENQHESIQELWKLNMKHKDPPLENQQQPPFVLFNPSSSANIELYLEKMKILQQKKALKERKMQRKESRNIKATFVVSGSHQDKYDIDQVLQQLGEKPKSDKKLNKSH